MHHSLEASVDDGSDEEDEEEEDDFIDYTEPVATDCSVSYCLLQLKHARVAAEDDWDSLLSRARFRARSSPVDLDGKLRQENEQYPFATWI
ncbi:hypothetical protein C0995_009634 [Termitomyces sp. Mi166|nr:hypothetical protein C0995_009634 [Termitomyces sp. Mi166\